MIDSYVREEALHRMREVGLSEHPDVAAAIVGFSLPRSLEHSFLFKEFPEVKTLDEVQIKRLIVAEGNKVVSVKRALHAVGLVPEFVGGVYATYGNAFPYFFDRLNQVRSQLDDDEITTHLLTGYFGYDTTREFNALNKLIFPNSRRVSLDLSHHSNYGDELQLQGDALQLPFANETFDTVQATDLLHMLSRADNLETYTSSGAHTPGVLRPVDEYFAEMNRVLKKGGSLILNEHDPGSSIVGRPTSQNARDWKQRWEIASDVVLLCNMAQNQGFDKVDVNIDMPYILDVPRIFGATGRSISDEVSFTAVARYIEDSVSDEPRPSGLHFIKEK